jgi:hypothetical protein
VTGEAQIMMELELKHNMQFTTLTVEVNGQNYVGQCLVEDKLRNVCTVTVWLRGQRTCDHFPQAAHQPGYAEDLATELLRQLVRSTNT